MRPKCEHTEKTGTANGKIMECGHDSHMTILKRVRNRVSSALTPRLEESPRETEGDGEQIYSW
jgi:hypothetical protein